MIYGLLVTEIEECVGDLCRRLHDRPELQTLAADLARTLAAKSQLADDIVDVLTGLGGHELEQGTLAELVRLDLDHLGRFDRAERVHGPGHVTAEPADHRGLVRPEHVVVVGQPLGVC